MRNKWLRMLAVLLSFTVIAAACGDDDDEGGEAPASQPAADTGTSATDDAAMDDSDDAAMDDADDAAMDDADDGAMDDAAAGPDLTGAELQLWGWASSEAEDIQLTALVDQFNADTGANARFEPQPEYDAALQAALVAGDPPDLFYVDSGRLPDLVASDALAPVPAGVISDPDDIYGALRDVFTIDGTWYCPPKDFSTLGLVYDPAAFEEAGIGVPTTWAELAAAAEALTTDDRIGLGFGAEYSRAGAFLFQAGGAEYASRFQFPTGVGEIQGVFNDNFQRLIRGETTVDELIAEVVSAGEDLL